MKKQENWSRIKVRKIVDDNNEYYDFNNKKENKK